MALHRMTRDERSEPATETPDVWVYRDGARCEPARPLIARLTSTIRRIAEGSSPHGCALAVETLVTSGELEAALADRDPDDPVLRRVEAITDALALLVVQGGGRGSPGHRAGRRSTLRRRA